MYIDIDIDVNGSVCVCCPDSGIRRRLRFLAGAFRAQGLVLLDGKGAGRDGSGAFLALEAVAVPFGVQGDDRIVGDRESAAGAAGGEEMLEVRAAVGVTVALVEGGAHQRLLAGAVAHEALLVP